MSGNLNDIYQFLTNDTLNTNIEGVFTGTGWAPGNVGPAFRALMGRLARVCQGLAPWNQVLIDGAAATVRPLYFTTGFPTAGSAGLRWELSATATAEGGSNAGSDFNISRFADTGALIDVPFSITRSTGVVSMPDGINLGTSTLTGGPVQATGRDDGGLGGQFRAIDGASTYGVLLINDATTAWLASTASGSPLGAPNAYRPFAWSLSTGAVVIDGTGKGVTFGGAVTVDTTLTVDGNATVDGALFIGTSGTFVLQVNSPHPALLQFATSQYIELQNDNNIHFHCAGNSNVFDSGGITVTSYDSGATGQIRILNGDKSVFFRNDATNFYILTSGPGGGALNSTYNSWRPFTFSQTSGAVTIDSTGSGTVFGGNTTVDGGTAYVGTSGTCYLQGPPGNSSPALSLSAGNYIQYNGNMTYVTVGGHVFTGAITSSSNITATGNLVANGGYCQVTGSITISGSGWYATGSGASPPGAWTFGISVLASSGVSATGFLTNSDARIKSEIEDITPEDGTSWVRRGRPRRFQMDGKLRAGFIAQEDIIAGRGEAVIYVPDDRPQFAKSDGWAPDGHRLIRDYDHDIAYLTAALQHVLAELEHKRRPWWRKLLRAIYG